MPTLNFNKLTTKAKKAEASFLSKLKVQKRKTARPVIVAMVGLVGSGKSSVANELAKYIGGVVISGDKIRNELRKQNERYEYGQVIAEKAVEEVLKQKGNVIMDSDFIDPKKRNKVGQAAKKEGMKLVYIRTYCDIDIALGRIVTGKYKNSPDDFFGGADSVWQGGVQSKGAVVKIREMWRRTPNHYKWVDETGGRWELKKLPFKVLAEIDTADKKQWKREVVKYAKQILKG